MRYKVFFQCSALVLIGPMSTIASTAPPAEWKLMARHGECMEISTLKRKIPDLGNISYPDAFVKFMREKGEAVKVTESAEAKGKMVEVSIPAKSLALIFVVRELCQDAK